MRANPLRDSITSGTPALGAWLSLPSSATSEIVGSLGFDYVCIDMQHGLTSYGDLVPMLQSLSRFDSTVTVRVPWNEPGIIGRVLDCGAMAVIVPMINTAEQAKAVTDACFYPPEGARSSGPIRALPLHGPDYPEVANQHVLAIPMIETVEAIENIDEILSVPGIEMIYVGPMDLGVSMGLGRGTADPSFLDALDHIAERCAAHGVVAGIHASPGTTADRIERGYGMVTMHTELLAMSESLARTLESGRGFPSGDVPTGQTEERLY